MEEELISVGIFWAIPDEITGGWNFYEIKKTYPKSYANSLGFINYPYSHYEKWADVCSNNDTTDCYHYPRGRVIYNAHKNKHRIFADKCLDELDLQQIVEIFEIKEYELCRDEHYVSAFTKKRDTTKDVKPVLSYNILRGKDKIGQNLIEVTYGDTKLLVELGKALDSNDKLSDIEMSVLQTPYNAVIVSHYHADHAGLINYKQDCPIYVGNGAYRILKAVSEYNNEEFSNNIITYRNGNTFNVGGIKITPFLCDHSAFDSYMLLFEADGKSILYTGDFRFHGRKEKQKLLSRLPQKVNTLIYEETNINNDKPCFSEKDLEDKAVNIIKNVDKPIFILQSASNIDRLVSFYRATKRNGKIFYEDNYVALIASAAGGKIPRPDVFNDVVAFTPRVLHGKQKDMFFEIENKRGISKIVKNQKFVMLVRPSMLNYIKALAKRIDLSGAIMIYSIWSGYKEQIEMSNFLQEIEKMGIQIKTLHTSGHASYEDIQLLKRTVIADEYVSIHTNANDFKSLLSNDFINNANSHLFLRQRVYDGLHNKFPTLTNEIIDSVERELQQIKKLCLTNYLLKVWDAVCYAKHAKISVGSGRGKIVGSLVSYALGITNVNPLKYSLTATSYFSSKTNEISIDFSHERKAEIFEYLKNKYGEDQVAHIGICSKKTQSIEPHLTAIALCDQPIKNVLPMVTTKDGIVVAHYDSKNPLPLGLHIFHALGLYALTHIQKSTELVKALQNVDINFEDTVFTYDDQTVFDFIANDNTNDIYFLNSEEANNFMRAFKPNSIEELACGFYIFCNFKKLNIRNKDLFVKPKIELIALYNKLLNSDQSAMDSKMQNIAYSYITYQMAYLKCYFPNEFEMAKQYLS